MELLIPGLILVALMAYASTKIKRLAKEAYEPETIEVDQFLIDKPEGILHVLNGDTKYLFEAYSKGFGVDTAGKIRLARFEMAAYSGDTAESDEKKVEETTQVIDGITFTDTRSTLDRGLVNYIIFRRRTKLDGKNYILEGRALADAEAKIIDDARELVKSLRPNITQP